MSVRDSLTNQVVDGLVKAFYTAKKDAKAYYFKAPNFTFTQHKREAAVIEMSLT